MNWQILSKIQSSDPHQRTQEIINSIFKNRGLTTPAAITAFLNPTDPLTLTPEQVGIDPAAVQSAVSLIHQAISQQIPILIYGDYDADGVTATAILWETLHHVGAQVTPFIPSREIHGYGLSVKGLEDALANLGGYTKTLVITVDNGIVANDAVTWLKERGVPVIVTDHHQPGAILPAADVIVHSTAICGAAVAWILAKALDPEMATKTLDLVCIGTVADMMPLTGPNRQIVKYGLEAVRQTHRPGLKALFQEAEVDLSEPINPYHLNFVVAPRINAMGRLEHAIDSLRLLCTKKQDKAIELAGLLAITNRNRQDLTVNMVVQAKQQIAADGYGKMIIIDHEEYHEGVVGLIAGKLVEAFYRPVIVISRKQGVSKASARSVAGINITELIRTQQDLLEGVGGHPMAAGFSIKTEQIEQFRQKLLESAESFIDSELLEPTLTIDCNLSLSDVTPNLYEALTGLEPFGIGNPQPVFALSDVTVLAAETLGKTGNHLKLMLQNDSGLPLPAIWFGHGSDQPKHSTGSRVSLAGTLNRNTWRGRSTLQLLVKSISG